MEMEFFDHYFCHHCRALLTESLEKEAGDLFFRCLECGAKNLLGFKVVIIGCRREESLAKTLHCQTGIQPSIH